jgi:four helix bundle protein
MGLNYEKLDVYRCAIEFLTIAMALIDRLGRGDSALKDQLRRASLSIPLNIAESSGKVFPNDRARFLAIARGSAMECGACLGSPIAGMRENENGKSYKKTGHFGC